MKELLDKIDDVRLRTSVGYSEAKKALLKSNGDVLEAVIFIEQKKYFDDQKDIYTKNMSKCALEFSRKLKNFISQGNVVRIIVKKDNRVLIDIPIAVGIAGMLLCTYQLTLALIASFVAGCRIYMIKKDNQVVDINTVLSADDIEKIRHMYHAHKSRVNASVDKEEYVDMAYNKAATEFHEDADNENMKETIDVEENTKIDKHYEIADEKMQAYRRRY